MRQTIAVLTFALLALTGCSQANQQLISATAPPAPSTNKISQTPEPPSTYTYTETRWASESTTNEATPTMTPPTAPPRAAFSYDCYLPNSTDKVVVNSWSDVLAKRLTSCEIKMERSHKATATEAKAVELYKQFTPDETTEGALVTMYGICADTASDLGMWDKNVLGGASLLCPNSVNGVAAKARAKGEMFDDGAYEVGVDIKPGRYQTAEHITDCYWERSTRGGDTIANDFVSNAPGGVTVRIRKSDGGFKSDNCGPWIPAD